MRRAGYALICAMMIAASGGNALAEEQRAVLTLAVNTVPKGEVTVTLRDADVLVRRSDLIGAGLKAFPFNRAGSAGDVISLTSLAPELRFHVDDVNLVLDITVTAPHLDATVVDFRPRQNVALARPVRSAFLNYSLSTSNQTGATFAGEFGTHVGAGMFSSTASFASANTYRSSVTRWVVDSPASDRRLTVGDVVTSTGDLGGTVAIAGFGLQRYFGLNPDTVKTVLPQISGNTLTPSTADVYVNGVLARRETLPPGQFDFQNLPVGEGPNTTTIVVTDAFGRQQTYSNTFYGADSLLARGLSDFSYGAGFLHSQFGEQARHGAAVAGRYTVGATNDLTAGARLEIGSSLASFGPNVAFRLPRGVLGMAAALSREGQRSGIAGLLSYQYLSRMSDGSVAISYDSPQYASLALTAAQDRPVLNASLSFARQLNARATLGFSYARQNDRDNGAQSVWQTFQTLTLSNSTEFQVGETLTSGNGRRQLGIATTMNFLPRSGYNASVSTLYSGAGTTAAVTLQRPASSQVPSLGYLLSASGGTGGASGFVSADYRGQYGDLLTDAGISSGTRSYSANAAGGIVFINGKLFATQALTDSYALVDAGGLANVRILANGVVAGRTDRNGFLVVPNIGSYYDNTISIFSADAPIDYSIDAQSEHLAPMYKSGGIVRFGLNRVRPVTGNLIARVGGHEMIPAFGILEVSSGVQTLRSDIGEGGEFYFDNLSAGVHAATVKFRDGECRFALIVPQTTATFIKLGTVTCTNGVHA